MAEADVGSTVGIGVGTGVDEGAEISVGAWVGAGVIVVGRGLSVGVTAAVGRTVTSSPESESEHAAITKANANIKNMDANQALVRMMMSKLVESPLLCLYAVVRPSLSKSYQLC